MAKSTLGGKINVTFNTTAVVGNTATQQQQQNQPATAAAQDGNATPTPGSGIDAFMKMSDQEKANAIMAAANAPAVKINGVTAPDNVLQKLAHALGIDAKPTLVSDAELDKQKGAIMYRSFSANTQDGADAITENIMLDNETFYSGIGASVYGRGIYFMNTDSVRTDSAILSSDVRVYGSNNHSNVVRAKLKPGIKTVKDTDMEWEVAREIRSGSAFGKALSKIDSNDATSIMAISKGYSAMRNGKITVVLDRSAINMSYTYHRITSEDLAAARNASLKWSDMKH